MKIFDITDAERAHLNELLLAYPDAKAVATYNHIVEQLIDSGYTHYAADKASLLGKPYLLQTIDV